MTSPEEIAGKLTKAQRKPIEYSFRRTFDGQLWVHAKRGTMLALGKRGLVEGVDLTGLLQPPRTAFLTPLGLAVRAYLQGNPNDN